MPLFVPIRKNEEDFFVLKELLKAIKGAKPELIDEKFTKVRLTQYGSQLVCEIRLSIGRLRRVWVSA